MLLRSFISFTYHNHYQVFISSDVYEVVAWGSAQIHCVCTANEGRVTLNSDIGAAAEENAVTNAGLNIFY